jgi:hypothetical protein
VLSELRQDQNAKYLIFSLICGTYDDDDDEDTGT